MREPATFAEDFSHRAAGQLGALSPREEAIVRYIQAVPGQVGLHTADSLAAEVGVSRASVIRCLQKLGYRGFLDLRNQCRADSRRLNSPLKRFVPAADINVLASVIDGAVANLRLTERLVDSALTPTLQLIRRAHRVYVLGAGKSYGLSVYFHHLLDGVRDEVHLVSPWSPQELLDVHEGDVVLALLFMRYSRSTVRALAFARSQGASTVVATDGGGHRFLGKESARIVVATEAPGLYRSMVPIVAVVEGLAAGIANAAAESTRQRLALGDALDGGASFLWK